MVNTPVPVVLEQKRKEERTERRQSKEERGSERMKFPKSLSDAMILKEA